MKPDDDTHDRPMVQDETNDMGRPPLPANKRKKKVSGPSGAHKNPRRTLSATPQQWVAWERKARAWGLDLQEWLRAVADAAPAERAGGVEARPSKVPPPPDVPPIPPAPPAPPRRTATSASVALRVPK